MKKWIAVLVVVAVVAGSAISAIYKWVDEQGVTHYAEEPPEGGTAEQVKLPPEPPKERLEKAQRDLRTRLEAERKARAPQAAFGTVAIGFVPSGLGVLPDRPSRVTLLVRRKGSKKDLRLPLADPNPQWTVTADKKGRAAVSHHNFRLHLKPGGYRITSLEIRSRSISSKPITLPVGGPEFTVPKGRCVYIGRMTYVFLITSPGSLSQAKAEAAQLARQHNTPLLMVYFPKGSLILASRALDTPNRDEDGHDAEILKAAVSADCLMEPARVNVPASHSSK